jgi:hypothetical protein
MKIYTLLYIEDTIEESKSSNVIGAFPTQELAHTEMKGKLEEKKKELQVTKNDIDCGEAITYIDGMEASFYYYGSYYGWTIQEFEV